MCIHHIAPVNTTFDTPTLVGYDSTLDNCDYVDVDQRVEISDNDIGLLASKYTWFNWKIGTI